MCRFGVSVFDFWDMTPQEMYDFTNSMAEKALEDNKTIMISNYNLASMVATFVNTTMAGKKIPDIYEVYPSMFNQEDIDKNRMEVYKQQFEAFAIQHNSKRALKGLTNDT